MSQISDLVRQASAVVTTDAQARALVKALGANPARIAWNARLDLALFAIASEFVKLGWRAAHWTDALAVVGTVRPAFMTRLQTLCDAWPKVERLPSIETMALIVDATPDDVATALVAMVLEGQ